jgi:BASS family bile acid:Na+ symporter
MMLLAASPGGTTANLFSHLAGGDVALNVTLTAINSVLSVLTLPLVVNLSLNHFMGAGEIGLQPAKMLQVFAIVLVPVGLGMLINRRWPAVSERLRRPVKIGSVVVLVAVIVTALVENRDIFFDSLADVGLVSLLLSILSLTIGYFAPRLSGIDDRQSIACSMEIGIHNATLAITIALSPTLLNSSEMAIAPAVYGILMFFPAGVVAYALGRRVTPAPGTVPAQPPPA